MAHHHGGSGGGGGGNEGPNQDFLEQLLEMQTYAAASLDPTLVSSTPMMLHLNSNHPTAGGGAFHAPPPPPPQQQQQQTQHFYSPLGLSLDQVRDPHSFLSKFNDGVGCGGGGGSTHALNKRFRDDICDSTINSNVNVFHGQPMPSPMPTAPHQQAIRPRVRARRGQATDPHSIAERLRRERIAERIRALQELVPTVNKTDRAAMLDEIVDYVKFLRLQVKVLSMSRLGGAGAVVPLVTDMPISCVEEEGGEGGEGQPVWEKWSNDGTERQVVKLMEENVGSAMQFLQSKALCIMPISLASAIYRTHPPDSSSLVKPESNPPP